MLAAVIRQRGQLTVPGQVRKRVDWLRIGAAVSMEVVDQEIRIRPYVSSGGRRGDWGEIWQQIALVRAFKGKKRNLSDYVVEDRNKH